MGRLGNGQKLKDANGNTYIVTNTVDLIEHEYGGALLSIFTLDELQYIKFNLIEENTIDEIEELDITTILDSFVSIEHQIREIKAKTNELVQAVNKINKKLREEE